MNYKVVTEGFVHHDFDCKIDYYDNLKYAQRRASQFKYCKSEIFELKDGIYILLNENKNGFNLITEQHFNSQVNEILKKTKVSKLKLVK